MGESVAADLIPIRFTPGAKELPGRVTRRSKT